MTIRDLGYRSYDGPRLPASNNLWVLLRHGLRRAWASWLVRLAGVLSLGIAVLGFFGAPALRITIGALSMGQQTLEAEQVLRLLLWVDVVMLSSMVTLGAGAVAISEDYAFKSFPFYFAKPVTPPQYLAARVLAIAIVLFAVFVPPLIATEIGLVGSAAEEDRLDELGLFLPALLQSGIVAIVMAAASVGVSALSPSRALTMSAWILLFLVPYGIAFMVDGVARLSGDEDGWPWLYLTSLPGMLGTVAEALFKIENPSELEWYHALPVLVVVVGASLALAHRRLTRVEVIA